MRKSSRRKSDVLIKQACNSIARYSKLVASDSLHRRKGRVGNRYLAPNGKVYEVFRETVSDERYKGEEVCLVVGFRLSLIGSNGLFHRLFQRLSLLDTPVWVGFPGFKAKFWMVDPESKNYLGIYRYIGKSHAKSYAEYICAVLKYFSTKGSVWYEIIDEEFEVYVKRQQRS